MSDLRKLLGTSTPEILAHGTVCLAKAGLTIATTVTQIKTASAIDYSIGGVLYTKAATDNIAVTAAEQADGTTAYYLICIDSSGTVSAVKGDDDGDLPEPTSGTCPIGVLKVVVSGGAFTLGTTDLDDATVTDTYYDIAHVPRAGSAGLA